MAALALGVWIGFVEPLLEFRSDLAAEVDTARSVVARQRALVARAEGLDRRIERARTVLRTARAGLLDAGGSSGAAVLQCRLRQAGEAAGVRIDSVRVLAADTDPAANDPVETVRLAASGTATVGALQAFLHDVESGRPWCRVDRLAVTAGPGADGALTVEIEIAAIAAGGGE